MNSDLYPYPWESPEYLQALSPGQQMAIRARSWIESNPEHWDQTNYHCGTSHCFAGVVEMLADGLDPKGEYENEDFWINCTIERARLSLGLDYWVAGILWFSPYLTLDNIRDLVKAYTAPLEQVLNLVEKHQDSNFITYIFCTIIERPDKHTIGIPENLKEEAEIRHYTFVNSRYIDEEDEDEEDEDNYWD